MRGKHKRGTKAFPLAASGAHGEPLEETKTINGNVDSRKPREKLPRRHFHLIGGWGRNFMLHRIAFVISSAILLAMAVLMIPTVSVAQDCSSVTDSYNTAAANGIMATIKVPVSSLGAIRERERFIARVLTVLSDANNKINLCTNGASRETEVNLVLKGLTISTLAPDLIFLARNSGETACSKFLRDSAHLILVDNYRILRMALSYPLEDYQEQIRSSGRNMIAAMASADGLDLSRRSEDIRSSIHSDAMSLSSRCIGFIRASLAPELYSYVPVSVTEPPN